MDRSWMNIEGFIQPINNSAGLHKLKENSCQNWFVIEDESKLLYYNQSNKDDLPNAHPEGSISLSSGKLEVFVVLTVSDDGKSYLLYPGKDENISEWLSNIKDKTNLVDETTMALQRNYQDSFMTRVRNSFRRKKKPTRSISQDSQSSDKLTMRRSSHSPLPTEDTLGELSESPFKRHVDSARKMKAKRSQSCPNESLFDVGPIISHSEKKHYADKCCDTSSLVSVDWVITDECTKQRDQSTQTFNSQHAEEALKDALMLLARSMPIENREQTTTHQPAMNYASGVMTLQQQKLIRGLEMEICKLKCEVINLIQGTINIPLKDDDLADWHYVEEIRYKERIFELLREARLCNPRLPNYDSSSSGNFKDAYGFIHGNRESDSVLFHYVCRELIQHYSSFFQDKTGHVKFWNEYVKAKKANDDMILFKERELKRLIEDGIPACCRSDVWNCFIQEKLEGELVQKQGLYGKLVKITSAKKNKLKSEMTEVERQIRCDLLRTMPSNEDFKTLDSIGVQKLSRILHAFVEYKPEVGYLQGMNFLVGMFLLFMEEEDAFWSLCAVVEVYLKNYFDQILSGAQADQEVLKDLIAETMPVLNAHFKYHGVDISTVTFNWLITLYLDAVPFETAVRIWDCFLFNGREVLFRIALGLLKLQQRSLLQLYGYMEIMQYMKRAARVTYDIDRLFKASFDEITKFPDNDELDEMQKKYRPDIEAKNDFRLMVKHERKRSRGNSFNVKITTPDRSDRLDHIQIVECAVAVSKDLSKPVCIPCSVRGETKVYLLDMNKQEIRSLETNIESRVLCADVLGDGTILIGTVSWYIYAFSLDFCDDELWSIQLNDSVIDLCHYEHDTEDKVYAALADGSIAVLPNANLAGAPTQGSHVRIGSAPVMCVTLVDNKVWCGCSNNIVVLETSTLEEVHALVVSSSARHQVALLIAGDHGVWCTIRGSSWVILIHPESYDILLQVNVASDTNIIDAINVDMQVTVSPFQDSRVTTVLPFREELWVGLGNGQVLIFDIADSRKHNEITTISEENVQYLEGKCSMKMRVHYRISEEPIRSLLVLRDSDGPIILSCAGTLSPEGGISVWQKEITEEDFEEWMPCPVRDNSHLIPVSPRSTAIPTIEIS